MNKRLLLNKQLVPSLSWHLGSGSAYSLGPGQVQKAAGSPARMLYMVISPMFAVAHGPREGHTLLV